MAFASDLNVGLRILESHLRMHITLLSRLCFVVGVVVVVMICLKCRPFLNFYLFVCSPDFLIVFLCIVFGSGRP